MSNEQTVVVEYTLGEEIRRRDVYDGTTKRIEARDYETEEQGVVWEVIAEFSAEDISVDVQEVEHE